MMRDCFRISERFHYWKNEGCAVIGKWAFNEKPMTWSVQSFSFNFGGLPVVCQYFCQVVKINLYLNACLRVRLSDDENDLLHFLKKLPNNRWTVAENVSVVQVKLDLLQLRLDQPILTLVTSRTKRLSLKTMAMLSNACEMSTIYVYMFQLICIIG